MNKENFVKYIKNFDCLNAGSLDEIKSVIDEFPYFQSAWTLYVKNLYDTKDIRFENKQKTASVFIGDRKVLQGIILGTYMPNQAEESVERQPIAIETQEEEVEVLDNNIGTEAVDSEQRTVDNEQFTVDNGQGTTDSEQFAENSEAEEVDVLGNEADTTEPIIEEALQVVEEVAAEPESEP
ncbi:MAG: hypothetical protein HUK15_08050, partial [Bacteroidales bacterium]|nr:hypothetical protein [Bacteroidales bacterium]